MVNKKYNIAATILVMFFIAALIVDIQVTSLSGYLRNAFIIMAGVACYLYSFFTSKNQKIVALTFIISVFLSLCMLMSILYNGNANIGELLWVWAYIGVALCIYNNTIDHKFINIMIYGFLGYILVFAILGVDPEVFFNGSRNTASGMTLLLVSISYYLVYENTKKIEVLPALIFMFLSIWGVGRSGIIVSLFFVTSIILIKLKSYNNKILKFLFLIMIIIISLVMMYFLKDFIDIVSLNFEQRGLESSRIYIWKDYFEGIKNSVSNLFFGTPFEYGMYLKHYHNPHNGFIMLHAEYGILAFLTISILIFNSGINLIKNKEFIYVVIITALFIRSMFDWTSFPGAYDIMWYLFILRYLDK